MVEVLYQLRRLLEALTRGSSIGSFFVLLAGVFLIAFVVFVMREITLWWFGISKIHDQLSRLAELMENTDIDLT